MRTLFMKAIRVWVVFYVLAVVNGLLRETVYVPQWGDLWGRVAGTAILVVAILVVMYFFLRRNRAALGRMVLVGVGVLWLGLSLFFEVAVTHWVMDVPFEAILAHYDVTAGRVRALVWVVELAGPIVLGARFLPAAAGPPPAAEEEPAEDYGDEAAADEAAPPAEAPVEDAAERA